PFGTSGEELPLSAIVPGAVEQTDPRFVEIQKAMERLNPQERQVVSLTFGFKDPQFNPEGRADLTQMEIAQEMGLKQTRINLILNQAIEKLRSPLGDTWKEYNRDFSYPERTPFGEDELRNAMQSNGSVISFDYKGKKVSGYVVKTFIKAGKIMHRIYVPTQENFGDHFINVTRKDY
ncbi:MAG TPA: sigma factor-like helix-turn-helix DNA-binding protein, partial [Nitrosopumilaceae archaeon]|nr:sigma factor-like helix-turn-helix DNA-binding protein [Nitrosopumilaceae archaeon]